MSARSAIRSPPGPRPSSNTQRVLASPHRHDIGQRDGLDAWPPSSEVDEVCPGRMDLRGAGKDIG
jgi:hypothetical protein